MVQIEPYYNYVQNNLQHLSRTLVSAAFTSFVLVRLVPILHTILHTLIPILHILILILHAPSFSYYMPSFPYYLSSFPYYIYLFPYCISSFLYYMYLHSYAHRIGMRLNWGCLIIGSNRDQYFHLMKLNKIQFKPCYKYCSVICHCLIKRTLCRIFDSCF